MSTENLPEVVIRGTEALEFMRMNRESDIVAMMQRQTLAVQQKLADVLASLQLEPQRFRRLQDSYNAECEMSARLRKQLREEREKAARLKQKQQACKHG